MEIEQAHWTAQRGWLPRAPGRLADHPQLALLFGSPAALRNRPLLAEVRQAYPRALLLGCSTAGEICSTQVFDESLVVTAVRFVNARVRGVVTPLGGPADSFEAGQRLAEALDHCGLRHVFVLSEGLRINGSELVSGLTEYLPSHISVTGGLSADGSRFGETLVLWGDATASDTIAAVGLYGDSLRVGYGSLGGWDMFGPDRLITRSRGNVLYELDGTSALSLYRRYLGKYADDLPASGLLFPLSLAIGCDEERVVRTILAVDEAEASITFAGDVPEGAYARLMKANFDRLVDGAIGAASASMGELGDGPADLALLISCVGRKLVLQQRVEEEVEGVREVLGEGTVLAGFYSYGEIAPVVPTARCALHNQTRTVTTFREIC